MLKQASKCCKNTGDEDEYPTGADGIYTRSEFDHTREYIHPRCVYSEVLIYVNSKRQSLLVKTHL